MDTTVTATIGGKPHGLQFHSAKISQSLFAHCEIRLELGFGEAENKDVFDKAVSSWLGDKLVLTVSDKVDSSINKKYEGVVRNIYLQSGWMAIRAMSEDYPMTLIEKHKSFENKDVNAVVNDVVNNAGISANMKGPQQSIQMKFLHQYDENDYDFLKRLARYDGCVFFHDGESFNYMPKLSGSTTVGLGLEDVSDVRLNCFLGDTKLHGVPYDYTKHADSSTLVVDSSKLSPPAYQYGAKVYQKSDDLHPEATDIINEPFPTKNGFQQFIKNQQAFYSGMHIVVQGHTTHPMVSIGRAIKSSNHPILKDTFVVTKLDAEFNGHVYSAKFEGVVKDSVTRPMKTGEREYMGLLQPAIVLDSKDPDALGRVQIQYLWDVDNNAHAWARVVTAGAGKNYGAHFTPRVGDQVLVGCEHGNPSLPIILGALYHSDNKPDCVTDNGSEEVLLAKTPAGSEIRVVDKQNSEYILLSMPGGKNVIRMELQGPKITIESVGGTITLHSKTIEFKADEKIQMTAKDIEMTTQKNITSNAGQDQKMTVGKDLSVSVGGKSDESVAQDKTVTAGTKLSQKAGTQAELSAGAAVKINAAQVESTAAATNVIKGALVQIN